MVRHRMVYEYFMNNAYDTWKSPQRVYTADDFDHGSFIQLKTNLLKAVDEYLLKVLGEDEIKYENLKHVKLMLTDSSEIKDIYKVIEQINEFKLNQIDL